MRLAEFRDEGGGADEEEVPSESEGDESGGEAQVGRHGNEMRRARGDENDDAGPHYGSQPEAIYETAGEEGRDIHSEDMKLNGAGDEGKVEVIFLHCEGSSEHNEVHHAVGDGAADSGDNEGGAALCAIGQKTGQTTAGGRVVVTVGIFGDIRRCFGQKAGSDEGECPENGESDCGSDERRGEDVPAGACECRTDDGGDDSAGENERDGAIIHFGGCIFHGGEAVVDTEGGGGSAEGVSDAEEGEVLLGEGDGEDDGADDSGDCASGESFTPADFPHPLGGEEAEGELSECEASEGKRGERRTRREFQRCDSGERHERREHCDEDGVARGEQRDIPPDMHFPPHNLPML